MYAFTAESRDYSTYSFKRGNIDISLNNIDPIKNNSVDGLDIFRNAPN